MSKKLCRICGLELKKETEQGLLEQGYIYVCEECDENFFEFEVVDK